MSSSLIRVAICASVAQLVEQGTENPRVIGSIPIGGTSQETQQGFQYAAVAHLVERHLAKVEVASSSLVSRSKSNSAAFYGGGICIWCRSQVVRQRSAKPLCTSSNLVGTSRKSRRQLPAAFCMPKITRLVSGGKKD